MALMNVLSSFRQLVYIMTLSILFAGSGLWAEDDICGSQTLEAQVTTMESRLEKAYALAQESLKDETIPNQARVSWLLKLQFSQRAWIVSREKDCDAVSAGNPDPERALNAMLECRIQTARERIEWLKEHFPYGQVDGISEITGAEPASPPSLRVPAGVFNVARTSLSEVSASSVNGNRSLSNRYYGIPNAFDHGTNWIDGMNYSTWVSDPGDPNPWAEVHFRSPVEIHSLVVEGVPSCYADVVAMDGTVTRLRPFAHYVNLLEPVGNIEKVKFYFTVLVGDSMVQVDEIQVLGAFQKGMTWEESTPRLIPDRRAFDLSADNAFRDWLYPMITNKAREVMETDSSILYTYFLENVPTFQVEIDRSSGKMNSRMLLKQTGKDEKDPTARLVE